MSLRARAATPEDAEEIARVYNEGIEDGTATFETRPRTAADVQAWFDGVHPIVVVVADPGSTPPFAASLRRPPGRAEPVEAPGRTVHSPQDPHASHSGPSTGSGRTGGSEAEAPARPIVAFAASSAHSHRECYRGVAEFSVYVARERRGQGAGRITMEALIRAAEQAGFWKLVARVFVDNAASRALLRSVGFREVGIYERHGRRRGEWMDVVIVERLLPDAHAK